jgi:hypothetical protein
MVVTLGSGAPSRRHRSLAGFSTATLPLPSFADSKRLKVGLGSLFSQFRQYPRCR